MKKKLKGFRMLLERTSYWLAYHTDQHEVTDLLPQLTLHLWFPLMAFYIFNVEFCSFCKI